MKNITMTRDGDKLVITINLKERFGKSASGKNTVIATTEGNVSIPGEAPEMKLGINLYTK